MHRFENLAALHPYLQILFLAVIHEFIGKCGIIALFGRDVSDKHHVEKTGNNGLDYQEAARAAAIQMRDELREYVTVV